MLGWPCLGWREFLLWPLEGHLVQASSSTNACEKRMHLKCPPRTVRVKWPWHLPLPLSARITHAWWHKGNWTPTFLVRILLLLSCSYLSHKGENSANLINIAFSVESNSGTSQSCIWPPQRILTELHSSFQEWIYHGLEPSTLTLMWFISPTPVAQHMPLKNGISI